MDPYPSFRYKYDFHIFGRHNPFSKHQRQSTNLVDYPSVYRRFDGYRQHVAERLHFAGIFLAAHTGWRAVWNRIRNRVGQGVLGDVRGAKKHCSALIQRTDSGENLFDPKNEACKNEKSPI